MKKNRMMFLLTTMVACFLFMGGVVSANAQQLGDPIEFSLSGVDDEPMDPGAGKGPIFMPTVWQSGYQLDFDGSHEAYVLRLVVSTDNVVYSTVVPSCQTQLWLPTYLLGYYRIELLTDELLFYGYITL